jgi:hypothetical protein
METFIGYAVAIAVIGAMAYMVIKAKKAKNSSNGGNIRDYKENHSSQQER